MLQMKTNKLLIGISLMAASALVTAIGQALWKLASEGLFSWQFYAGFFCYFLGAVLMVTAFKFGSLSVLHPILSVGYVFAILIGIFFLNETMTMTKVIANILIILGAVFIGFGGMAEKVDK